MTAFAAFPVFLMLQYGRFVLRKFPDSRARIQYFRIFPLHPRWVHFLTAFRRWASSETERILAELHVKILLS